MFSLAAMTKGALPFGHHPYGINCQRFCLLPFAANHEIQERLEIPQDKVSNFYILIC